MQDSALTLTNTLGLDIHEGSADDLHAGCLEARRIRNEVNRLDADGHDWDEIKTTVVDNSDHIKNTSQLLADKAFNELTTYHDHKDDNWGRPYPYIHEPYPIKMNHGEGYTLTLDEETGDIHYRITALRYHHVRGTLTGSREQLDRVRTALQDNEWRVGTAELVPHDGDYRLHVTTTHETHTVGSPDNADTVIGVDINEDCIALAAMNRDTGDVIDSLVIEYPAIKETRHEYFTKRKRMQQAGQTAIERAVQTEERDYVHDQLHKKSREVVEWLSQFTNPSIVFEDLKDMRDDIDYGTRMNRRLHSLPFAKLRDFVTYKAAQAGIPSDDVDPEYTSQRCPRTECLHVERANRWKKRFKCTDCEFQDHSDRKAAVCVCQEWFSDQDENVPSLETLPRVQVRRAASGAGGGPDAHGANCASGVTPAVGARPTRGWEARAELKTVAPSGSDG